MGIGVLTRAGSAWPAAAPNAKVTLTDKGTPVSRSTQTNTQGKHVFSQLNSATSRLEAEASRFTEFDRPGIIVGTQAALVIDIALELSSVTESVKAHKLLEGVGPCCASSR